MRVARHNGVLIFFSTVAQRRDKPAHPAAYIIRLVPQVQAGVQRHLIVAAAGGVQFFAQLPQPFGKYLLHEHMDIFRT